MSAEWDGLRREARKLENQLEGRLQVYSRLNARLGSPRRSDVERGSSADDASTDVEVALEIERLLGKLAEVNARMERCPTSNSTASRALLKRFREILADYKSEFRKTQTSIVRKRESAELFREVSDGRAQSQSGYSATEQLLRERGALNGSHRGADSTIGQALSVRESLRNQRLSISGAGGRLLQLGKSVPGINNLIQLIQRKRTRDNTILALVIAICICFLLWYALG